MTLPGRALIRTLSTLSHVFHERAPFVIPKEHDRVRQDVVATVGGMIVTVEDIKQARQGNNSYDSLCALVSQLGMTPPSQELSICEGSVEEMKPWDGLGYKCLISNRCSFGSGPPPQAWIYDFDLFNFRWDDRMDHWFKQPAAHLFNCNAEHFAYRRFGPNVDKVCRLLGGYLKFKKYHVITHAVDYAIANMEL